MNTQKLILFNDLKKYFKRKDPFYHNYNPLYGNEIPSSRPNMTINHHHHHHTPNPYDWMWFWYPTQHVTNNNINYNYGSSDQTKEKKEEKKGITGEKIMAGLLMVGAVTGVSYFIFKDFFDYSEEKDLLRRLKDQDVKTSHNQLFVNTKPLLKQNLAYSRDFLITKTIGLTSSIVLLADIFYWDDQNIMNSCFMIIGGSIVFGIGRYLYYHRTNQSSQSEASYQQVHSVLYGEKLDFQETGPRPPPYNPDDKKDI